MGDISYYLGIVGMILLLFAFLMGQLHYWKDTDLVYDAVNFIGAVFLVIYAIAGNAVPFIILEAIWALYALHDIVVDMRGDYKRKHHLFKPKKIVSQ